MSRVNVYCCGGAGINIGSLLEDTISQKQLDYSIFNLDTSEANISGRTKNTYLFKSEATETSSGSGKIRTTNRSEITNELPQVVAQFKPTTFNIVIFSATGGSGSAIGPMLLANLLKAGQMAIAFVVVGLEDSVGANNALSTMNSLDGISGNAGLPVVGSFYMNDQFQSIADVNSEVVANIVRLSVLLSDSIQHTDSNDIINWAQYTKSTKLPSVTSTLHIVDESGATAIEYPLAVASLLLDKTVPPLQLNAEYDVTGYHSLETESAGNMYYVIDTASTDKLIKRISAVRSEFAARTAARPSRTTVAADQADNNGMVW